jgi:hypothetical protein
MYNFFFLPCLLPNAQQSQACTRAFPFTDRRIFGHSGLMMAVCASCKDPLVIEVEEFDDDDEDVEMGGSGSSNVQPKTVPDDVHLNCGCHFHW